MTTSTIASTEIFLVRYGTVPEVARFVNASAEFPARGVEVVVETDRGLQMGAVLERLKPGFDPAGESVTEFKILRAATESDLQSARDRNAESEEAYPPW